MDHNNSSKPSLPLEDRTANLKKSRLGVSAVKWIVVVAVVSAITVGVVSLLDGNRALTADEASRQAVRAIAAAGVAILGAVLYAACARINARIDMELDRIARSRRERRRKAERAAHQEDVVRTASQAVVLGLEAYKDRERA